MNQHILKQIDAKIESNQIDYANNFISRKANEELDTAEAKKNVDSADYNMLEITKRIAWLENLKKSLE